MKKIYEKLPLLNGYCWRCGKIIYADTKEEPSWQTEYQGAIHTFCEKCMDKYGFFKREEGKLPRCQRCTKIFDVWCQQCRIVHDYNTRSEKDPSICKGCYGTRLQSRMAKEMPRIRRLLKLGRSQRRIAKTTGIPRRTIGRWLKEIK